MNLPAWSEMTDLDKGAALLHLRKRRIEGPAYAVEEYPARYFDHAALTGLGEREACRHAVSVAADTPGLDTDEYRRLYDLALDTDNARALREIGDTL